MESLNSDEISKAAEAFRLQQARELIESLTIEDPVTGEVFSRYEPDPADPKLYRTTATCRRIEAMKQ